MAEKKDHPPSPKDPREPDEVGEHDELDETVGHDQDQEPADEAPAVPRVRPGLYGYDRDLWP